MRLVTLLVLLAIALAVLGVISFHWNQDSVSVQFDRGRAKEVTERAIDAGRGFSDKIKEDISEAEKKQESGTPQQ